MRPPATGRCAAMLSTDYALGPHAHRLTEAERVGAGRARHGHRQHKAAAAGTVTTGKELLQRHLLRAPIGALYHHRGVQRQQRGCEIAVGGGREQIAAHRRHGAHRRPADHARHRMQEGQVAAGEDIDHAHAGADRDARALVADLAIGGICGAHQRGNRRVALVDGAHQQRAAGEETRGCGPRPVPRRPRSSSRRF